MFTGLIADLGSVSGLEPSGGGTRLRIATRLTAELQDGDSIAVDGVCLTVTDVRTESFEAEAMAETLTRSSLGRLRPGDPVNLELALRAEDRLGGHVVQGHVDGTGTVAEIRDEGFARVLEIETGARLARYLVEKGSVALNGVSLTVSALGEHAFTVALIPETLRRTNLGALEPGSRVNVEVDVLAKHLERLMATRPDPVAAERSS